MEHICLGVGRSLQHVAANDVVDDLVAPQMKLELASQQFSFLLPCTAEWRVCTTLANSPTISSNLWPSAVGTTSLLSDFSIRSRQPAIPSRKSANARSCDLRSFFSAYLAVKYAPIKAPSKPNQCFHRPSTSCRPNAAVEGAPARSATGTEQQQRCSALRSNRRLGDWILANHGEQFISLERGDDASLHGSGRKECRRPIIAFETEGGPDSVGIFPARIAQSPR